MVPHRPARKHLPLAALRMLLPHPRSSDTTTPTPPATTVRTPGPPAPHRRHTMTDTYVQDVLDQARAHIGQTDGNVYWARQHAPYVNMPWGGAFVVDMLERAGNVTLRDCPHPYSPRHVHEWVTTRRPDLIADNPEPGDAVTVRGHHDIVNLALVETTRPGTVTVIWGDVSRPPMTHGSVERRTISRERVGVVIRTRPPGARVFTSKLARPDL